MIQSMSSVAAVAGHLEIHRLPIFTDNYVFLWFDPASATATVIDPGTAAPVLACLQELQATLTQILITHHHWDHVNGIPQLLAQYPQAQILASATDHGRIPGQTVQLRGGEILTIAGHSVQVLTVPGHTLGHIAYYVLPTPENPGHLFCGDTLFGCGCGRLKEGTPAQLWQSLKLLRELPDTTQVWCAHEYTLKNIEFALGVDPENLHLQTRYQTTQTLRQAQQPTIPTTLGLEKQTNPFLRCEQIELQRAMNAHSPLQTFTRLRGLRDQQ